MIEKVKILVVEDEVILGLDISQRLNQLGYEVLPVAKNPKQAMLLLENHHPDILILDINLGKNKMDGIDLAHEIRKWYQIPYIFLTSHSEDAILQRSKAAQPAAYILKPFNDKEIKIALEIALSNFAILQDQTTAKNGSKITDSLFLKKDHRFERVKFEHILWLQADSNYTEIHTMSNTYVYSALLKKVEAILPHDQFFRVHRSYVVNKENISGFEGNSLLVQQEKIPVSKQYRSMIFQWFNTI